MKKQRSWLFTFLLLAFFGIISLFNTLGSPHWVSIRGVDALRLIGTGMCFGGAIFSFAAYVQGRRFTED